MHKIKLIDICHPKQWKTIATSQLLEVGKFPVYGANGIIGYYNEFNHEDSTVLITCRGATCGNVHISDPKSYINGNAMALDNLNEKICLKEYLYYFLSYYNMAKIISGSAQPQITIQGLKKIYIKVYSIEEQKNIIKVLNRIKKIIDLREKQITNLDNIIKSQFVKMFGTAKDAKYHTKTLVEIAKKEPNAIKRGPFGGSLKKEDFVECGYLVYEQRHAIHNDFEYEKYYITEEKYKDMEIFKVKPKDLLISCSGTLGKIAEVPENAKKGIINQALLKITLDSNIMNNRYFMQHFRSDEVQEKLFSFSRGSGISNFPSINEVKKIGFVCPPIELQNQFAEMVKKIEKQKLEIQKSLEEIKQLEESLMSKYFEC